MRQDDSSVKITNNEWLKEAGCFLFDMDGAIYLGDRLLPASMLSIYSGSQLPPFPVRETVLG